MKNDGGPAFSSSVSTGWAPINPGMSLRDYFAGQALIALLSRYEGGLTDIYDIKDIAYNAFRVADALLSQRGA